MNYIKVVKELNAELFEWFGETDMCFGYSTDGHCHVITFGDNHIWSSEIDGREWIDAKNGYEPFEPFIRRTFNKWVEELYLLKLPIPNDPNRS